MILAWKLNAEQQGYFTRTEWQRGMESLRADTPQSLASKLDMVQRQLKRYICMHVCMCCAYMCVCAAHVCVYVRLCMHESVTYVYTRMMHAYSRTCNSSNMHQRTCTQTCDLSYTRIHTHAHVRKHATSHIHAYIHTHTCANMRPLIYTHTYTRTRAQTCDLSYTRIHT